MICMQKLAAIASFYTSNICRRPENSTWPEGTSLAANLVKGVSLCHTKCNEMNQMSSFKLKHYWLSHIAYPCECRRLAKFQAYNAPVDASLCRGRKYQPSKKILAPLPVLLHSSMASLTSSILKERPAPTTQSLTREQHFMSVKPRCPP